jgi:hypothetical protein
MPRTAQKVYRLCYPALPFPLLQKERVMPASLRKFSEDRKINASNERRIQCPYCPQRYLLVGDDDEWNSVKNWIRVAEAAVRRHGDIELPTTLRVLPKS